MERRYVLVVLLALCTTPLVLLGCTPPADQSAATAPSANMTVTAAEVISVDVPAGVIVVNAGTQETLVVTNATVFSPQGANLASLQPHTKVLFAYKMEQGKKVATQLIVDAASVRSDPSAGDASNASPPPTDATEPASSATDNAAPSEPPATANTASEPSTPAAAADSSAAGPGNAVSAEGMATFLPDRVLDFTTLSEPPTLENLKKNGGDYHRVQKKYASKSGQFAVVAIIRGAGVSENIASQFSQGSSSLSIKGFKAVVNPADNPAMASISLKLRDDEMITVVTLNTSTAGVAKKLLNALDLRGLSNQQ